MKKISNTETELKKALLIKKACSTFKTKLQGILKKQKHAVRITFHANRFDHWRSLLKEMKALNVYHINLIQTLKFMTKLNTELIHEFFFLNFKR